MAACLPGSVAVRAYLENRCIEQVCMLTGMLIMAAAPVQDDLMNILFVEFFPGVAGVTEFRRLMNEEHLEVRPVGVMAACAVAGRDR